MRFITLTLFATLLSAPAFAADLGTYRPGTPYHSSVSAGADVCDNQCAGDAQCRGWNYVKPNSRAPGICEYLSSVSTPISSQISISGENMSAAPFSSRVTSGGSNTIRVGTQIARSPNTVAVGQVPSSRRVVRQDVPQRVRTQSVSTKPVENMSLTAQQNRYRQGQQQSQQQGQFNGNIQQPQSAPRQASRQAAPVQRPAFRPILDAASAGRAVQQPQIAQPQRQTGRRITGPRRAVAPAQYPAQVPFQAPAQAPVQAPVQAQPQYQRPPAQIPYAHNGAVPNQLPARGASRPPVGQPIPAPRQATAQPSTPSQRLAQFTAQTQAASNSGQAEGAMALSPQQAQKSLFGSLNDDLGARASSAPALPVASAVPSVPVAQQELGPVLAGGR